MDHRVQGVGHDWATELNSTRGLIQLRLVFPFFLPSFLKLLYSQCGVCHERSQEAFDDKLSHLIKLQAFNTQILSFARICELVKLQLCHFFFLCLLKYSYKETFSFPYSLVIQFYSSYRKMRINAWFIPFIYIWFIFWSSFGWNSHILWNTSSITHL